MHTKVFRHFFEMCSYYLFQFTKHAEILIPLALLISSIKVLTTLNTHNEIVAMLSAGLSLKKLMGPFFFVATLCVIFLYINFQWILPTFERKDLKIKETNEPIGSLNLVDDTLLIYQKFDPKPQAFFDAYWIENPDLIYRIEWLYPFTNPPLAKHVDVLEKKSGMFKRIATYETQIFPQIQFEKSSLFTAVHPPSLQSLSQLFSALKWRKTLKDKEAAVATIFFYKLFIPFACFLVILGPSPFCFKVDRHLPLFLIYAFSLFGIVTFFMLINSCVILGKSQILSPFFALMVPIVFFFSLFGWRYARL